MEHVLEQIYAGFLGLNIGIRLGAPVEAACWSYGRIAQAYGTITGYLRDYSNFAADDDVNGPVFFTRAIDDAQDLAKLQVSDVAEAWLNYTREGQGMFWWGGYGVSTEHTAFLNLRSGIPAPLSGSAKVNGRVLAEQIGGQIFIETWGLVCPGEPERAAGYARMAASVSHDGEALHGAAFVAAMVARAFQTNNVGELLEAGLAQIPEKSAYARVVREVIAFHEKSPADFRACRAFLEQEHPYERYGGACPVISNAGVVALALCYGEGDFSRTVEIAVMCGWDTDCNASNVGAIMGVACGLSEIPERYRAPIGDGIVLSGISGYLNILDIPTYARRLAGYRYRLLGLDVPPELSFAGREGELHFDFSLPGSTHGFRTSDAGRVALSNGGNCLLARYRAIGNATTARIYYKPFYRREDFDDERYQPVFSPQVNSGQRVRCTVSVQREAGTGLQVIGYVRESHTRRILECCSTVFDRDGSKTVDFIVPDLQGGCVDEVGLILDGFFPDDDGNEGVLCIRDFAVTGAAHYRVDWSRQCREFSTVTPCSTDGGAFSLDNGALQCVTGGRAQAMTGNYYNEDVSIRTGVTPCFGTHHLLGARVKGALYGLYAGLGEAGEIVIIQRMRGEESVLAKAEFAWEEGRRYALALRVQGKSAVLSVDGAPLLRTDNVTVDYGMVSLAKLSLGRTLWENVEITEYKNR